MRAVCPRSRSAASTSAPAAISSSTVATSPERAALIRGVSPIFSVTSGSAPASSRRPTRRASPFRDASHSGVASRALRRRRPPGAEQRLGGREIAAMGRPVQGRRAVPLTGVGVRARRQEVAHRGRVARPRGGDHVVGGQRRRRRRRDRQDGEHCPTAPNPCCESRDASKRLVPGSQLASTHGSVTILAAGRRRPLHRLDTRTAGRDLAPIHGSLNGGAALAQT